MAIETTAIQATTTDWTDCGEATAGASVLCSNSNVNNLFALADAKPSNLTVGFRLPANVPWVVPITSHVWIIGKGSAVIVK